MAYNKIINLPAAKQQFCKVAFVVNVYLPEKRKKKSN